MIKLAGLVLLDFIAAGLIWQLTVHNTVLFGIVWLVVITVIHYEKEINEE